MKAYVAMMANNLKALYSGSALKFSRNLEKLRKLRFKRAL